MDPKLLRSLFEKQFVTLLLEVDESYPYYHRMTEASNIDPIFVDFKLQIGRR